MATQNKKTLYGKEQKVFFGVCSLIVGLFSLYVYFVSASIVHVIVRKETDREITAVSTYISDLETRYIEAKDAVDEDNLASLGFTVVEPEKVYINKTPSSLVLVSNDN